MNLLAFDTCFGAISAAVRWRSLLGDAAEAAVYEEIGIGHAERLMPMLSELLTNAGLKFQDLDALAMTFGPGNFTGLRVGVAAARGLALAARLPVYGASSLAVMAHRARRELGEQLHDVPIVVAVDARHGGLYVQAFDATGLVPSCAPQLLMPEIAARLCAQSAIAVGNGAVVLAAAAGPHVTALLPGLQPDARSLIALVPHLPRVDPVVPLYLRAPDAKPQTTALVQRATP